MSLIAKRTMVCLFLETLAVMFTYQKNKTQTNQSLWRINELAEIGSAARLSGLTGVVDLVLFKKGGKPGLESNYKTKLILISANIDLLKQNLWY
ncbi:hypothetical protein C3K47_09660 [Solitalea longa]|uniref:Uncharacterized protein n=1 Tax=Solitalea longa TaxID=2079460 RepID=A0A2S5A212_9SPHI|nr:hypothetical protein [Solitalea longa]POY36630.1 hypothetical protein C3K47_09660 [Solitalea longa]